MLTPRALDQVWRHYATHDGGTNPAPSAPRGGITRQDAITLEQLHASAAVHEGILQELTALGFDRAEIEQALEAPAGSPEALRFYAPRYVLGMAPLVP